MLTEKFSQEQRDTLNEDLPLLIIMISIITDNTEFITFLKNNYSQETIEHYLNKNIASSPWTVGVLINMGYTNDEIGLSERPISPNNIQIIQ